ncbi:MAG: hypothetical protein QW279_08125 [Candidatus Jordarchaeaceae archaeon]
MESRFKEIADRIAKFTTKKSSVAFLDDQGNVLYSSLTKESETAVKKLSGVFPVWSVGDYLIKKLLKSNILIYKVSNHTIVALDSYEKEGVLIIVGKRLEENFAETFKELESVTPATPSAKPVEAPSAKPSAGLAQASLSAGETKIAAQTSTSVPTKISESEIASESSMKAPPSVEVEETVTVSFPVLVDSKILKKVKDPMAVNILNLCDGGHTIDDISEELKIPKARVMIITGEYSAKGAIRYLSGIRKVKR